MATFSPLAADEQRARAAIAEAVNEALAELSRLAQRLMLTHGGQGVNWKFLRDLNAQLRRLAEKRSIEITGDALAAILERGARSGWGSVEGASLAGLDPQLVDIALGNAQVLVQDILDEGVKLVNREMTKAVVAGKPLSRIADALEEQLVLAGADAPGIPRWRAELIARSELHSVYRQAQVASGEEMGFECFIYEGPLDSRTEDVCRRYVGQIHTREEWEEISLRETGDRQTIFIYGLHYGCRHVLRPVPCPDEQGARR